jgi:hypothetical protein
MAFASTQKQKGPPNFLSSPFDLLLLTRSVAPESSTAVKQLERIPYQTFHRLRLQFSLYETTRIVTNASITMSKPDTPKLDAHRSRSSVTVSTHGRSAVVEVGILKPRP